MTSNKPQKVIRIGRLKAAIWQNDTENGSFATVTFSRSYKDGESYKSSSNFGQNDLLVLSKLADQVHSELVSAETYLNEDDEESASR